MKVSKERLRIEKAVRNEIKKTVQHHNDIFNKIREIFDSFPIARKSKEIKNKYRNYQEALDDIEYFIKTSGTPYGFIYNHSDADAEYEFVLNEVLIYLNETLQGYYVEPMIDFLFHFAGVVGKYVGDAGRNIASASHRKDDMKKLKVLAHHIENYNLSRHETATKEHLKIALAAAQKI